MRKHNQIQYLKHGQIDKEKWNANIEGSPNGLIYACSFYLDHMANEWDALVMNDYEAVMPLTWNKKWGVRYLYQPPFTQQLGVFSKLFSPVEFFPEFLLVLKDRFRFAEIYLNYCHAENNLIQKTNFILSLKESYKTVCKKYSRDAIKNIHRSEKFQLHYSEMVNVHEAIELYKNMYAGRTKHVKENDYRNFEQLCLFAQKNKMLVLRKVTDGQDIHALALLLLHQKRLYLLQSTTLPAGRVTESNYFLLDNIVKEFCDQDIIFDFEGSDIEGIAHFYKNFGAVNQPYYFFRYNNLPWLLKLFK